MSTFTDRTLVVSGGSRGIGLAIALGAAKHGANVVLLAKTAEPRPPADVNGKCVIDSAVLAETGVTDPSRYGGGDDPILDIFVDKP
jgi:NAD(P)-dependent dehydrogenase (short-subunit alcohol dehydrogenase family)